MTWYEPEYTHGYYGEKKKKKKKDKKCKFVLDPDTKTVCGRNVISDEFDYCIIHQSMKCYCAVQATHFCGYCLRKNIKYPLCDNLFCNANHNITKKHIRMFYEW